MQRNRGANGADEMSVKLPDSAALMDAHRAATENTTKIANAACHYALSVNRTWLELWQGHLDEYLELPKRVMDAQTDFFEHAFDHYQEGMQKLGGLASKATQDVQSAVRETQGAGERAAGQIQSEVRDMGWGNRPKEAQKQGGGEHREGAQQHSGH